MSDIKHTLSRRVSRASKTKHRSLGVKPRLVVHRSNKNTYAQIVGMDGKILAAADSSKLKGSAMETSRKVGEEIAKMGVENKISDVVFDRKHYKYHGRVKAVAEGARENGLKF